jgi:hypothetical protein
MKKLTELFSKIIRDEGELEDLTLKRKVLKYSTFVSLAASILSQISQAKTVNSHA